jgi:2-methylisocitrate lyase-like PEP mutase family enzyme
LRALLARRTMLVAPGAADAFMARLIEDAGFEVVYMTGAGVSNALLGMADVGLATLTEMADQARRISEAVQIPVISDADTGYGNPLNVRRTVRAFEQAGAAGIHIEDQVSPKRCGHFSGKEVIDAEEMAQKVRAACEARRDPDFLIIARTDSLATHGFEEAVRRANRYAEAGADMVFVDAPTTRDEALSLPSRVRAPALFNMTEGARTPLFSHAELAAAGYALTIHPNLLLRVAGKAMAGALHTLKAEGTSGGLLDEMMDWNERQRVVGLPAIQALERKYAALGE